MLELPRPNFAHSPPKERQTNGGRGVCVLGGTGGREGKLIEILCNKQKQTNSNNNKDAEVQGRSDRESEIRWGGGGGRRYSGVGWGSGVG